MYILNPKIIDETTNFIFPQVEGMSNGYDWGAENSVSQIKSYQTLSYRPDFNTISLDSNTYLTDLLSQITIPATGLLISEHLVSIFEGFNLQDNTIYPAPVNYMGKIHSYSWLHFLFDLEKDIDYQRSIFGLYDMDNMWQEDKLFTDSAQLEAQCQELVFGLRGQLIPKSLHFQKPKNLDLFVLITTEPIYYLSNRLAQALLESHTTGYELFKSNL